MTLAALSGLLLSVGHASAEEPEVLMRFGSPGTGAGQLDLVGQDNRAGGISTDPKSGHVFVSENGNNRISEFTAWGEFVKAWGWGVRTGAEQLETCTSVTGCQKGLAGVNSGQLDRPNGVALDSAGNIFVFEGLNRRIQVFSPAGDFLRMFGGGVDKTSGEDVCTAASGHECGEGTTGTGPSEFSMSQGSSSAGDYIDVAEGVVYVGDANRIQKFSTAGLFLSEVLLPEAGQPGSLAVDPVSKDIYFAFGHVFDMVKAFRLVPTGEVKYQLPTLLAGDPPVFAPQGVAVDGAGRVYLSEDPVPVFEGNTAGAIPRLAEISAAGTMVNSCCASSDAKIKIPNVATNAVTFAGDVDVYLQYSRDPETMFIEVRGPAPDRWPAPEVAPTIEGQFATSLTETSATLKSEVNPNFWADTSYWVEWGSAPCSEGGCVKTAQTPLGSGIVKKAILTDGVDLASLSPNATYHYRFVSESGGGGPTFGADKTFTTYAPAGVPPSCPNDGFRTGLSANLWECRAYELVSPVDKFGGEILVIGNINDTPSRLNQAAPDGEKITYSSYRSFGDAESAAYSTQYIASRAAGKEWSTHAISAPREGRIFTGSDGLDSQYKAFLEDLSSGWFVFDTEPVLATGGVPGYPNVYRRDNLTDTYEAISDSKPTATPASVYEPEVQGRSSDGSHTVFRANGKLTGNASSVSSIFQTYESANGTLRLVSIRPGGAAAPVDSTVGSRGGILTNNREAHVETAVSEDGSKIYWSEIGGELQRLYVRVNGTETIAVSAGAATFLQATPDGSKALYTEGDKLQLFDLGTKSSTTLVLEGGSGMGASEDLSRIYFGSTAALAGGAKKGDRNLYLYDGGSLRFIGARPPASEILSPFQISPRFHLARVSPDGATAVFVSRGAVTGEENLDAASGEPDAEVFRYDLESDELLCLSCLSNGARANGRELELDSADTGYWYASLIPGWEMQLHAPRVLSDDGDRVYFNSLNSLVPQDTNGMQDVYEWEAPGKGDCEEGSPNYREASGGCVNLISSGTDPRDSEFVDASTDGRDVFFLTGQSLLDQDPGQWDLYDAREGGGLPTPPLPGPECEGEAGCLPPATPAPAAPGPGASQGRSSGNVVEPPKKPKKCRKGFKRNKKGKCVRKHKKQRRQKNRPGSRR